MSLAELPSSPQDSFRKRKRDCDPLHDCDDYSLPSGYFSAAVNKQLAGLSVDTSLRDSSTNYLASSQSDHGAFHASRFPPLFPHRMAKTALSMSKGRISNELTILEPPLYVASGSVPIAKAKSISKNVGLRQRHLYTITTILHRCLLEGDHIRAGRAWAMLLRAEQNGHSIELRTHDRWGVGAEVLLQRKSQVARNTLDRGAVEIRSTMSSLRAMDKSMEKAKEYYERAVLQYPYRKAFPTATGPLDFYKAMFSLWIYTVEEQGSVALTVVGSTNMDFNKSHAEPHDDFRRSSASSMEADHYRKRKQIKSDTLKSAHEIATRLDGLLVSPPFSDNARFWKLCGEVSLWIADLSVSVILSNHDSSTSADEEDLTVGSSSLLRIVSRSTPSDGEHRAGRERQIALAKAEEAFQRVRICSERRAE